MGPVGFALSLLLILALFSTQIHSLRFDVESGHTKCISEDMKSNAMTVGKYSVVNPDDALPMPDTHKLAVRVRNWFFKSFISFFPFQFIWNEIPKNKNQVFWIMGFLDF